MFHVFKDIFSYILGLSFHSTEICCHSKMVDTLRSYRSNVFLFMECVIKVNMLLANSTKTNQLRKEYR